MTKLLQFVQREGFTNKYVKDEAGFELGFINTTTNKFLPNSRSRLLLTASDLYEIADNMAGNPPREELNEAHNELLAKHKRLRKRVTELTQKLESGMNHGS